MKELKPMLMKKFAHALCTNGLKIYSCGGYDSKKVLSDCQCYNVSNNKWHQLPSLLTPRECPAAFLFNRKEIYVVGGYNGCRIGLMEKMSNSKWENVNLKDLAPMSCVNAIQIGADDVLLFGCGKYSMVIAMGSLSLKECGSMKHEGTFFHNAAPVWVDSYIYAVDNCKLIHCFSIKDKKWSFIEK